VVRFSVTAAFVELGSPRVVAEALGVATLAWLITIIRYLARPGGVRAIRDDLRHPVFGPFGALVPAVGSLLPAVAASLLTAQSLATIGQPTLAVGFFAAGILFWLLIGAVLLARTSRLGRRRGFDAAGRDDRRPVDRTPAGRRSGCATDRVSAERRRPRSLACEAAADRRRPAQASA